MQIPKQVSFRKAAGTLAASILIVSAIFYAVWATAPSSTFWLAPGIYPGAPEVTVWREGNNYFAKDANGEIIFSGTNVSDIVNDAVIALQTGSGGAIKFCAGTFEFTHSIVVPYDTDAKLLFFGEGIATKLKLEDNANTDLFVIRNSWTTIEDMELDGNDASNTAGNGVKFQNYMISGDIDNLWLERLIIHNFNDSGVWATGASGNLSKFLHVSDCVLFYNDRGIYLDDYHYAAFVVNTELYYNANHGVAIQGSGEHRFVNVYSWTNLNGLYAYAAYDIEVNGGEYSTNGQQGIRIDDSEYIVISGVSVNNNDNDAGGYDGIRLVNTNYTQVSGYSSNILGVTSQHWGYQESGTSDWNTVLGLNAYNNAAGGVLVTGSHTHCNATWNGTVWCP